jgi:hypothetical protein
LANFEKLQHIIIGTEIGAMRAPGSRTPTVCRCVARRERVPRKRRASALGWFVLAFQAVDRSAISRTTSEVGMSTKDRRYSGAVTTPPVAVHESAGKPWPGLRSVNGGRRSFLEFTIIYYHLLSFLRKFEDMSGEPKGTRRPFAARAVTIVGLAPCTDPPESLGPG